MIIEDYKISISQIFLLEICRIMAFKTCCRKAGVTGNIDLFRSFYHNKKIVRGYYFSNRPKKKDFVLKYTGVLLGGIRVILWGRRKIFIRICVGKEVGEVITAL